MALARPAARAQFVFVAFAFGCLAWSFVTNDFSVVNVAQQFELAAAAAPIAFAATWGSHEGSLLLWVLMLAGWTRRGDAASRATCRRRWSRACSA